MASSGFFSREQTGSRLRGPPRPEHQAQPPADPRTSSSSKTSCTPRGCRQATRNLAHRNPAHLQSPKRDVTPGTDPKTGERLPPFWPNLLRRSGGSSHERRVRQLSGGPKEPPSHPAHSVAVVAIRSPPWKVPPCPLRSSLTCVLGHSTNHHRVEPRGAQPGARG